MANKKDNISEQLRKGYCNKINKNKQEIWKIKPDELCNITNYTQYLEDNHKKILDVIDKEIFIAEPLKEFTIIKLILDKLKTEIIKVVSNDK